jgi:HlyD family secretion protein
MRRRTIGIALSLCALAGAATAFVVVGHGKEARANTPPSPEPPVLVAPGVTEGANDVVDLSFQTTGSVAEVLVETGATVKKGDLLARLDDRVAKAELDEAVAALEGAHARRDASFAGSRVGERAMADAELAAAQADASEQAHELARGERLLAQNAIGAAEVDRYRTAATASQAHADSARARATLVHEGVRAEVRREAVAGVAAGEARRREAETLLSYTELRAPCDGVILRRKIEPGEQVSLLPPTVAFTLVDMSKVRVRAEIDEQDIGKVRVGETGWTTAAAFGDKRFPGKVVRLMHDFGRKQITADDPHARNDTRVLEALVELDGRPDLPVGLRMDVHVPTASDGR